MEGVDDEGMWTGPVRNFDELNACACTMSSFEFVVDLLLSEFVA